MSEDVHAEGASVEHEQPARISAACETLANVRINAADSLADFHLSNKTGTDHATTSTATSASSENIQKNTRFPISKGEVHLTPSVEPDFAPFDWNQKVMLSKNDIATQDVSQSLHLSLDEASDHLHGIVLDGVNEMQSQTLRAVKTVNTHKEIAVVDIHREKEDALHSFRNELALETSDVLQEIEMKKIHALTEIAALGKKRFTESTFESRYTITGTESAGTQEIRDVLILHSDEDLDLANKIMDIIVNQCALPITIDIYAKFAIGESKINIIDDIFIKYRWVLFLVTRDYELYGFHNFQGGAVLMKELEENGYTHGRFVPLLTGGIKRTDIKRAWLKSLQPIWFPDDTFIETIVKLVERFRKFQLTVTPS